MAPSTLIPRTALAIVFAGVPVLCYLPARSICWWPLVITVWLASAVLVGAGIAAGDNSPKEQ